LASEDFYLREGITLNCVFCEFCYLKRFDCDILFISHLQAQETQRLSLLKADLIRMALDKYHLQLPTGSPKRAMVEQTVGFVCLLFCNRVELVSETQVGVCDVYMYF
jgi:hypothetical protein